MNQNMPAGVVVVQEHILWLVACAPLNVEPEEVEREVRSQRLAGTRDGWRLSKEHESVSCDAFPEFRRHHVFGC